MPRRRLTRGQRFLQRINNPQQVLRINRTQEAQLALAAAVRMVVRRTMMQQALLDELIRSYGGLGDAVPAG